MSEEEKRKKWEETLAKFPDDVRRALSGTWWIATAESDPEVVDDVDGGPTPSISILLGRDRGSAQIHPGWIERAQECAGDEYDVQRLLIRTVEADRPARS
jgi:hypothetical protein